MHQIKFGKTSKFFKMDLIWPQIWVHILKCFTFNFKSYKSYNLKGCVTFFYIIPLWNFSMNSFKNTLYLCFFRSYTLPRGCKSEDVTSNLSADGVLMITAAKKKSIQEASRKVPIEMKKWFSKMFQYFSLYHQVYI